MGAGSKYDVEGRHRALEQTIKFEYAKGIQHLLKRLQYAQGERIERADFALCDVLIDLELAIGAASLTETELSVIQELYIEDQHYAAVADSHGITVQGMYAAASSGCKKIARVFAAWGYGDLYTEGG